MKIEGVIRPFLKEIDVDLVELNVRMIKNDLNIQIIADKSTGGITLDECSELNKDIIIFFEEQSVLDEDFSLEVSSPGLDRPLKTVQDFKRVRGREIRILFNDPVDNQWETAGRVAGVQDENVILRTDFQESRIAIRNIKKAVQVF